VFFCFSHFVHFVSAFVRPDMLILRTELKNEMTTCEELLIELNTVYGKMLELHEVRKKTKQIIFFFFLFYFLPPSLPSSSFKTKHKTRQTTQTHIGTRRLEE